MVNPLSPTPRAEKPVAWLWIQMILDSLSWIVAMTVALAASAAFMTPISSPANTLVVGPGHYTFGDFVRIGVPFAVVVMMVSLMLVPWLLPFH